MTTLVTGAGLVGTSFARVAAQRGEEVVFYDARTRDDFLRIGLPGNGYKIIRKDLRDLPGLIGAIQDHAVATIVFVAGSSDRGAETSLGMEFALGVGGAANVAEAARLCGVRRIVQISTAGVYDSRREGLGPIKESFPRGPGGAHENFKAASELVLESYARQHGLDLIVLRTANVFGIGRRRANGAAAGKLQELAQNGVAGRVVRLPTSQTIARDYLYAKDLGMLIDRAAVAPMPKQMMFNAGSGLLTAFDDLIETARRVLPELRIELDHDGRPRAVGRPLDISAALRHFGWAPQYSLEDGFRDYVEDLRRLGLDALERIRR